MHTTAVSASRCHLLANSVKGPVSRSKVAHATSRGTRTARTSRVHTLSSELGTRRTASDSSSTLCAKRMLTRTRKLVPTRWLAPRAPYLCALRQSMDNMWHVLFHAIPTRELFLRRGLELQSVDFLPRYTIFWPVANARENYNKEPLRPVLQWPGWETLMRSLIHARTDVQWPELAARTQELIVPQRWHCYRRLIGGHVGWWPRLVGRNYSALFAARPSAQAFRSVVMRNLGVLDRSPELRVVFELRDRSRWAVGSAG